MVSSSQAGLRVAFVLGAGRAVPPRATGNFDFHAHPEEIVS